MFEVQRSTKEGDVRVSTALNRMLGLPGARVRDVAFGQEAVIVTVVLRAKKPVCSGCGARGLKIKEHREKRWRALDLGGLRCVIECRLKRLYCPGCGDMYEAVPWARAGSRYTRDFEDLTAWLAQQMSQTQVERLLRIAWRTVGTILARVVADKLDRQRLDGLVFIGVDEVSYDHSASCMRVTPTLYSRTELSGYTSVACPIQIDSQRADLNRGWTRRSRAA
jgi:transposase